MKPLFPLLLTVALVACRSAGAPASHAASFDREIQLAPGEQVAFGEELTVKFVRVAEDSRCPTDVACVWAGEVKVQLSTQLATAKPAPHEIAAGQHAMVGAFRLVVVQVQPERISTREISPEEYRVTLRVERPTH
jgi:hypothetical protein